MIPVSLLIVLAMISTYTDLRYRRIPNILTLGGMAAGMTIQTALSGTSGLLQAAGGGAIGFGILLLLHLFGAVGAGDVKLFGAIGALSGPSFTLSAVTYSILFAGVIGVCILVVKKQLISKGSTIAYAVFGFLCLKQADSISSIRRKKDGIRFPFLLAVVPGLAAAFWELMG